jgi:hypothetical protein
VKLRVGRARVDLGGAAEQKFRIGKATLLQANEAEAMERVEVPAVGFENDPIAMFRLLQTSVIVQQRRFAERLRDVAEIALRMSRSAFLCNLSFTR